MNAKMQECFKPHAVMHSLFGLGLGILIVALIPELSLAWLGFVLIVIALVADYMRK